MADTPKVRFKGFTDDWEQRKLNDVADIVTGTTPSTKDKNNYGGTKLFVSPADIQGDRYVENTITTLTNKGFSLGRELRPGTILFVSIGSTIGKVAQIKDYATTNQQINAVIPSKGMDDNFTFSLLEKESNKIRKMSAQQAVPIINKSTFGDIEIMCPSKEEQEKIGAYFANLDRLITLYQRKCEETKELKKYMLQKMFPQNGQKIPEIRFSGFTEDWEQRKLSEVLINLQNNTLSRAELSADEGVAKNIHYGDILVKFGEVLDVSDEQLPMIKDDTIVAKYKTSFLQNGDVIIADTAEDETVGKCTEIAGLDDETVISGLHTIPYRPLFEFASGYLGYYMNSTAYHSQLLPLMQGIKVTSISKSAMQNTDIVYPKSVDEQKQIGDYFRNTDRLITLHQHKCGQLKEVKKFMLQNMFPQKG